MITKFNNYINESRKSIDELEILTSDELGKLLIDEAYKSPPDIRHIQDLLTVGCPIDARDYWEQTSLHVVARYGHLDVVKFLLSKGADVHARDEDDKTAWDVALEEIKEACPELKPIPSPLA